MLGGERLLQRLRHITVCKKERKRKRKGKALRTSPVTCISEPYRNNKCISLSSFSPLKGKTSRSPSFTGSKPQVSYSTVQLRCVPLPRTVPCPAKVCYRVNQPTGHFVFVPEQCKGTCQQTSAPQFIQICKKASTFPEPHSSAQPQQTGCRESHLPKPLG